jgi:hypothetical protein
MLAVLAICGCHGAGTARRDTPAKRMPDALPAVQTQDFEGAIQVGEGPYRYRFVLNDAGTGTPAAKRPFALSHHGFDLPFVAAGKDVYQGVTDALGRTPVFAFAKTVDPAGWSLRERFGSGDLGEQFTVSTPDGEPLPGMPYSLVACSQPPVRYRGISDANGLTGYVASKSAVSIKLFMEFATFSDGDDATAGEEVDAAAMAHICNDRGGEGGAPGSDT